VAAPRHGVTVATYPGAVAGAGIASARSRVLAVTVLGLVLLVAAGWATRALLTSAQSSVADADGTALCEQHALLMSTLEGEGAFATQAGNHAARRLSDLAQASDLTAVQQSGDDIRTVLGSVAWEVPDLVTATRPIALVCGWDWPIGTAPPSVWPAPPSS
jgi:hypothetical protein